MAKHPFHDVAIVGVFNTEQARVLEGHDSRSITFAAGMGAKGQNYHTKLMQRMGFEEEALKIQDLFFAGKRDEAIMAVPDDFADEISIVGPPSRIRERLKAWEASPVTTLMVAGRDPEQLKVVRDLVLG